MPPAVFFRDHPRTPMDVEGPPWPIDNTVHVIPPPENPKVPEHLKRGIRHIFTLQRMWQTGKSTVGLLHREGKPLCFVLEDGESPAPSGEKVHGETRIPAGLYPLCAVREGGFYRAYKKRWGHEFAIGVEDVPGFTLIRIHTGNDHRDTLGCPLVGDGINNAHGGAKPALTGSRNAYERLYREHLHSAIVDDSAALYVLDEGTFRLPTWAA